jgi:1,4-alpha-glucan branching enzyme
VTNPGKGGAGFDAAWNDGLRDAVRNAVAQASGGADATIDMTRVAASLRAATLPDAWRAVNCLENHDIVKAGSGPRVARLADPSDARSWYARSRARVALGLLLTAPGIPQIFMGQEFLEDKQWSDDPDRANLLYWDGLAAGDKAMVDFLRFTQELVWMRRRERALSGERINVFHVHDANRVLAFHRWLEGQGADVVVVASLRERTYPDYRLGMPAAGGWREVFNSDVYDNWVNPQVAGNGGRVVAEPVTLHGLPATASLVLPANSIVVLTRE